MSKSVFAGHANAVLVFQVASSEIHEDPVTGNKMPIAGTIEVKAMLKPPSLSPTTIEQFGSDRTRVQLEGRTIDPMRLPNFLQVGARAQCTLTNAGHTQTGEFEITSLAQSPFETVTDVLGAKLQGILTIDKVGGMLYA